VKASQEYQDLRGEQRPPRPHSLDLRGAPRRAVYYKGRPRELLKKKASGQTLGARPAP
jgi:hypothetical protein